ncbi:MAG: hypothetical protein CL928_05845 [Deltaproteobacteria bacterium]|nr:hypothetical protein [Deltaproteobacteria bacterium]
MVPTRLRPLVLSSVLVVVVLGICGLRLAADPIQAYGDGGAHFREHALRLELLNLFHACDWPSLWDFFVTSDQELHPPLLHLVTGMLSPLLGHTAEAVAWSGFLWLLLLAVATGATSWALSGRLDVSLVTASACVLIPAAHASAARYYYDLPMTAMVWSGVAILALGCDRRPLVAGVAAGLALFAAILIKWVALPVGVLMAVGVLWSSYERTVGRSSMDVGARVVAGLALTATLLVTVSTYVESGPSSLYAGSHTFGSASAQGPLAPWMEALPRPLRPLGVSMTHELASLSVAKVLWYPLALVARVFSPAWFLALMIPALAWWRGRRTGLALVGWTVVGQLVFLVSTMNLRDSRFLLPMAPALVVLSALGWGELRRELARRVAVAGAVVGIVVAADFHGGPDAPWNAGLTVFEERHDVPPLQFRGLGLADSFEQRGWSRGGSAPDALDDGRQGIWDAVAACGAAAVGTHGPVFSQGGALWLRYRAALAQVRQEGWTGGVLVMTPASESLDGEWRVHPDNGWSGERAVRRDREDWLRSAPSLPPEGGFSLEERRHLLAARLAPMCEETPPSRVAGLWGGDELLGAPSVVLSASLPAAPVGWVELQRLPRTSGLPPVLLLARSEDACAALGGPAQLEQGPTIGPAGGSVREPR